MPSFADPIVAVRLHSEGHSGITLYAPPWEDSDGEEWQGFLGDGSKIVLLGTADELNTWLGDNPDHDLADHPSWPSFESKGKRALEPAEDADFDLGAVFELAADAPDEDTVTRLADLVDMATRIADCCEDGMLRATLTGTGEYVQLVSGEFDYTDGKAGATEWSRLGEAFAANWDRALGRIDSWLRWEGSSAEVSERSDDDDSSD